MTRLARLGWLCALALQGGLVAAAYGGSPMEHAGPPTETGLYQVPEPGSYELPAIRQVSDRLLLDANGETRSLLPPRGEQLTLVSFVYTSCSQASGCPAAFATLRQLDRRLALRPEHAKRVRLVTVSFDPERDTPERMARVRSQLAPRTDWRFLTAADPEVLAPILDEFGQRVYERVTDSRVPTGVLEHVLQISLVDSERAVRNVYSSGLLDPALVVADLETLLLERDPGSR